MRVPNASAAHPPHTRIVCSSTSMCPSSPKSNVAPNDQAQLAVTIDFPFDSRQLRRSGVTFCYPSGWDTDASSATRLKASSTD